MGEAVSVPCDTQDLGESENREPVERSHPAHGRREAPTALQSGAVLRAEAVLTEPSRSPALGGQLAPKHLRRSPSRDILLPEDRIVLEGVIAQLRSERLYSRPQPDGDLPVEDLEAPPGQAGTEDELKQAPLARESEPGVEQPDMIDPHVGENILSVEEGVPTVGETRSLAVMQRPSLVPRLPRRGMRSQEMFTPRRDVPFTPRQLPTVGELGSRRPDAEERRWIEAAVRRIFLLLTPATFEALMDAFREWRLPPGTKLVEQGTPVTKGPGLCVLLDGVVDVLHCPTGASSSEKVCTYDRCGQCFGELELFYDQGAQRRAANGRKLHWATIATRTPTILWTVQSEALLTSPKCSPR